MTKQRLRATSLVVAGVVAGGILAGTLGAQAANQADDDRPGAPAHVRVHFEGPGGPRGQADLAKELGVSQKKLHKAFASVRDDVRPAKRPDGPPSEADIKAMESKLAAALADKLGLGWRQRLSFTCRSRRKGPLLCAGPVSRHQRALTGLALL